MAASPFQLQVVVRDTHNRNDEIVTSGLFPRLEAVEVRRLVYCTGELASARSLQYTSRAHALSKLAC